MKEFRSTLISISSISFILLFSNLLLAQQVVGRSEQAPSYKRPIVESVRLKGVHAFKPGEIEKFLYVKPNHWFNLLQKRYLSKSNVKIDEVTIRRFYMRRGYLFTQVQSDITYSRNNKATVTYYIDEGRLTTLTGVGIQGGLEPINKKFIGPLAQLKVGMPLNAEDVISNGFKLRDLYADNGYPYAIDSSRYEFSIDSTQASLTYAVAESVYTINDSTAIVSKLRTRPYVIRREIVARPGKMYRQKDITDSEQRLYTSGLFKFVSIHRNDSTAVIINDTCHVGFRLGLDERKQYYVGMGVGLGNQQSFDLVFRTFAQWGIRNIAGTGRGVAISVRPYFQVIRPDTTKGLRISDFGKRFRYAFISAATELDYVTPWIFKYRVPLTAKFIYEPYTLYPGPPTVYRFDRISGEGVFSREIDHFTTARFTAHAEFVKIRHTPPELEPIFRKDGKNQIRRILQIYIQRDTRDNILVPQKGSFSFGGAEYAGGLLGGDFNYHKIQFSWSRYHILTGSNVLATRLWLGWLDDLYKNGNSAPEDRFVVGGATTIRGYTNQDLGPRFQPTSAADSALAKLGNNGRYMMLGNVEIRRPLFWRFGGSVFVDGGNTYAHLKSITPLSIRFSSGLGVQFFTPVGPIRLDYAVRLKKQFDLGAGLLHFSILYAF
jgi:outer membrane protein insertion porin family